VKRITDFDDVMKEKLLRSPYRLAKLELWWESMRRLQLSANGGARGFCGALGEARSIRR
jgi:hypothetical protein